MYVIRLKISEILYSMFWNVYKCSNVLKMLKKQFWTQKGNKCMSVIHTLIDMNSQGSLTSVSVWMGEEY